MATHLKIENPAPVLSTNNAILCCRVSPTITVGLQPSHHDVIPLEVEMKSTCQGMCDRFLEVAQKPVWKTRRPKTEMARSSYLVF